MKRSAIVAFILMANAAIPLEAQSDWDRYGPGSLRAIAAQVQRDLLPQADTTADGVVLAQADFPTRATVTFGGSWRPLSAEAREVLGYWAQAFGIDDQVLSYFEREILVREGESEMWLPVQEALVQRMGADLSQGTEMTVFTMWVGGHHRRSDLRSIFIINEFIASGIMREIDLGAYGKVFLGVELVQRGEILAPKAGDLYPLRAGTFGGAEQIYVDLTNTNLVRALHFKYETGTDFSTYLANSSQVFGEPVERVQSREGSQRVEIVRWMDAHTIAELEQRFTEGVARVSLRLIDRRLSNR